MKRISLTIILLMAELVCMAQQRSYYWTSKGNYYWDNDIHPEMEFGYYTKGAAAGEPCSAVMLAYCYLTEHGTQRNLKKAQQILDTWATKSDVTAFAAMKFYLPKESGFGYRQSVGSKEVYFPFAEDCGLSPNITKSLKSLSYLEKQCDNDQLVDIYLRDARELTSRVKLYCHKEGIGGIKLQGLDYVSTALLAGYPWEAKDTIATMFNKCTNRHQVDSVKTALMGLYPKAEQAGTIYRDEYPDIVKEQSEEWESIEYKNFLNSVDEKDSLKCAIFYSELDEYDKKKAGHMLSQYYDDNIWWAADSLVFKNSDEFYSFCPSPDMKESIVALCNKRIKFILGQVLENVKNNRFDDPNTEIRTFEDAEHLISSVRSCVETEAERQQMILDFKDTLIRVGINEICNMLYDYQPISSYLREGDNSQVVWGRNRFGGEISIEDVLSSFSPILEYETNLSSMFKDPIDIMQIMFDSQRKNDLEAWYRYSVYNVFNSLTKKIHDKVDKYKDYQELHSVIDQCKGISSSPEGYKWRRGPENYDMLYRYFLPYESRAYSIYLDESAIDAADKLNINSTRQEIAEVLKMPMSKETKKIVKAKTKRSYLESKSQ